jgi:predicted nucleotidyltransferase
MLKQVLEERRDEIVQIASKYGAGNIRVFGSVARGEDTLESDVDLLVEFDRERSLFDHIGLLQDLEDLLGRKVQIATDGALHPYLRDRILAQAVPL